MALPGAVNLTSALSTAPLICEWSVPVRIVGEPMVEICRGGPAFFLWPGQSVTTTYVVKALRVASGVTATATADPGNVCFESRESNNTRTSPPSTFFKRPRLSMSLNRPGPPPPPGSRRAGSQVFPVTITNIGEGPAIDVALVASIPTGPDTGLPFNGPELLTAYKGPLVPEGQTQPHPITPVCNTLSGGDTIRRICSFRVTLEPTEALQARYRFSPCPSGGPYSLTLGSDIHVTTADDLTQANHTVHLHNACQL